MNEFEKRINLNVPLQELSKIVCDKYNLGKFKSNRLIKIGYEDYNYVLTTISGKFVVKVFSNHRTDKDCKNLANRATIPNENGFSCPKVYKTNNENLLIIMLNNVKYRILVMQYINGKDFFTMQTLPSEKELSIIAKDLAILNRIDYNPPFIYDKWAIINFENEYKELISLVDYKTKAIIDKIYNDFKTCDLSKLKYGFVHGDIIETNVMKDEEGKLFYIDFSVSNFLPIIIDLAVTICDLCIDLDDINKSKERANNFVENYEKITKLDAYEKKCLNIFIACHQALTVLETTREKILENNNSQENEIFLNKGLKGLSLVSSQSLISTQNIKINNQNF